MAPDSEVSKTLKVSKRLKSGLNESSCLALSISLSSLMKLSKMTSSLSCSLKLFLADFFYFSFAGEDFIGKFGFIIGGVFVFEPDLDLDLDCTRILLRTLSEVFTGLNFTFFAT